MNVWILTSGTYSDYHVEGVFSTEENARAYARAFEIKPDRWRHFNEPFPVEVDAGYAIVASGLRAFNVVLDRDGNLKEFRPCYQTPSDPPFLYWSSYHDGKKCTVLRVEVWARDREHALKIANERRIEFIAQGNLPP